MTVMPRWAMHGCKAMNIVDEHSNSAMVKQAKMSSGRTGQDDVGAQHAAAISADATSGPSPERIEQQPNAELHAKVALLQEDLKSTRAELKIHKDAWLSETEKYAALSAKFDREAHNNAALSAKLVHVCKLIRGAESAFYEQCISQASFDADSWREMYQKLVKAVMPLFVHRD